MALAEKLHITPQTIIRWDKEQPNIDTLPVEEQIKMFDKLLYKLAIDKNSPAKLKELFAKRYGLLIDKSETKVKFELTADDLAREILGARRELEDKGMAQVQLRPSIFSGNLRLDSGQDKPKNN
ncbi:unnamed protein product [marine sediment metagenome]|uniref:Uncharacterized protein n=1 Tax=marine sediment metagenome TaxID=412755 RepID=X1AXE9_9ZZZZ